jgi:hypothetical protein
MQVDITGVLRRGPTYPPGQRFRVVTAQVARGPLPCTMFLLLPEQDDPVAGRADRRVEVVLNIGTRPHTELYDALPRGTLFTLKDASTSQHATS